MRATIIFVLALAAAPAAAQADVTVLYAEPAPMGPLVALPVAGAPVSPPIARREAPPPSTEPRARPVVAIDESPPVIEPIAAPVAEPPPRALSTEVRCEVPSPVRFVRTTDGSRETRLLHLTDCHGAPDPEALLELSILARPRTADRPSARDLAAHVGDQELFASEVRRLDPGLLTRLQALADHFPGHDIELTSGYRPDASETSRHRTGHALDLRVVGAPIQEVHAFALGFDESGVGLYPTSEFLHVDVRQRVTRWVDLAGPGEPANMVEVVTGRDGHAASAPALRWPAPSEPASPVHDSVASGSRQRDRGSRDRGSRDEEEHRAALREALEALDALEGLDLQVP
jgi:hypothetical protein